MSPCLVDGSDVEGLPGCERGGIGQDGREPLAYGWFEAVGAEFGQRRHDRSRLFEQRRSAKTTVQQSDVVDLLPHLFDE